MTFKIKILYINMKNNNNFNIEESISWLKNKCLEKDLNNIEDLEEFANNTIDINESKDIYNHLDIYLKNIWNFFIVEDNIANFKMDIEKPSESLDKVLVIKKKHIINLNMFNIDIGDYGKILVLNSEKLEIISIK